MSTNQERNDRRVLGFLGVGLDNKDGHQRLTQSDHFVLVGGSEETHASLQEIAIKFTAALERRGKLLQETPVQEVIDLLNDAADS